MNIEEDSIEKTIIHSKSFLRQVHISDNNRKMPGFGHINFSAVIKSLKQIQFDKILCFEPFVPDCDYENDINYGINTIMELS
jgi:sugar phosphate isomerase/epimerase